MNPAPSPRPSLQFARPADVSPVIASVALFIPIRQGRVDHSRATPLIAFAARPA